MEGEHTEYIFTDKVEKTGCIRVSLNQIKNKNKEKNSLTHFRHLFMYKRAAFQRKEAPLCIPFRASFTVEAAITVPVFICFLASVFFFFSILQLQMKVESALHYTARSMAVYSCLEKKQEELINPQTEYVAAEVIFRKQLLDQKAKMENTAGKSLGISLLTSDLTGDYLELKAVYQIRLPITLLGIHYFPMHQTVKARKWTGDTKSEIAGDWVYITPTGTVYHMSKGCPYLDLSIHSASSSAVSAMRNKSGGKYQKCSRCNSQYSDKVYITDYGSVYHADLNCSGLKRTVNKIKKSDVGERGPCSKCGGER